jgi:hypothetical protein
MDVRYPPNTLRNFLWNTFMIHYRFCVVLLLWIKSTDGAIPECECQTPLLPHFKPLKSGNNLQPLGLYLTHKDRWDTWGGDQKWLCEGPPKLHVQIVGGHPIPFGINTTRKIHFGGNTLTHPFNISFFFLCKILHCLKRIENDLSQIWQVKKKTCQFF